MEAGATENPAEQDEVKKRGRGRPRKNTEEIKDPSNNKSKNIESIEKFLFLKPLGGGSKVVHSPVRSTSYNDMNNGGQDTQESMEKEDDSQEPEIDHGDNNTSKETLENALMAEVDEQMDKSMHEALKMFDPLLEEDAEVGIHQMSSDLLGPISGSSGQSEWIRVEKLIEKLETLVWDTSDKQAEVIKKLEAKVLEETEKLDRVSEELKNLREQSAQQAHTWNMEKEALKEQLKQEKVRAEKLQAQLEDRRTAVGAGGSNKPTKRRRPTRWDKGPEIIERTGPLTEPVIVDPRVGPANGQASPEGGRNGQELLNNNENRPVPLPKSQMEFEKAERRRRRCNIVMNGINTSGGRLYQQVGNICKRVLGYRPFFKKLRILPGGEVLAETNNLREKLGILKRFSGLEEAGITAKDDLTLVQQEIQNWLQMKATEAESNGHKTSVRYQKICIDGTWRKWQEETAELILWEFPGERSSSVPENDRKGHQTALNTVNDRHTSSSHNFRNFRSTAPIFQQRARTLENRDVERRRN